VTITTQTGSPSTALLTDHYELTMLKAALRSGIGGHRSVFELFARRLPSGRRYGVAAGVGRFIDALERFRFGSDEIEYLRAAGWLDTATLDYLRAFRFEGSITGYREGELYWDGSPILTVEAPFAHALVLETLVLSIFNFDSAVASAASRVVTAAGDRPVIEMGGRRTHEAAAVAAARAAYIAGFASTSNLEAGRRHGIPTAGTSSHAFTLAHPTEESAFRAQIAAMGSETTLLVDTFDVETAIKTAVEAAGPKLGAIRLDSGDLAEEARRARKLLDELGATATRVVASGDLDEYEIARLEDAPIDTFGVGTSVVTGSGAPTANFIYKLVARAESPGDDAPLIPVEKHSLHKATIGGRKHAWRLIDDVGNAYAELISTNSDPPRERHRPLQHAIVRAGEVTERRPLDAIRRDHMAARAELSPEGLALDAGPGAIEVITKGGET
jgi:nicotinate phosphoribosyltransferase